MKFLIVPEPVQIRTLIEAITAWGNRNFDHHDPLSGVEEEIGEWSSFLLESVAEGYGRFAHYRLKKNQKIRAVSEESGVDALADTGIYLLHFAGIMDAIITPAKTIDTNETRIYAMIHTNIAQLLIYQAQVQEGKYKRDVQSELNRCCSSIFWCLCNLANIYFNKSLFSECIVPTWEKVSKRDWLKFPKNGVNE